MAIVRTALGTNQQKAGVQNWTALSSITLAVGDLLIVGIGSTNINNITSITWNGISINQDVSATNSGLSRLYSLVVTSAATGDIVVNNTATSPTEAIFASKITMLAASPLDITGTGTGSSTTPSLSSNPATSQASEIWIGSLMTNGPSGDTAGTWSNGFSAGQRIGNTGGSQTSNWTVQEGFQIVSSTGNLNPALTGITSRSWALVGAAYKGAASVTVAQLMAAIAVPIQQPMLTPVEVIGY